MLHHPTLSLSKLRIPDRLSVDPHSYYSLATYYGYQPTDLPQQISRGLFLTGHRRITVHTTHTPFLVPKYCTKYFPSSPLLPALWCSISESQCSSLHQCQALPGIMLLLAPPPASWHPGKPSPLPSNSTSAWWHCAIPQSALCCRIIIDLRIITDSRITIDPRVKTDLDQTSDETQKYIKTPF